MIKKECCKCGKTEIEAAKNGIRFTWTGEPIKETAFTCVPYCDYTIPPKPRPQKHRA